MLKGGEGPEWLALAIWAGESYRTGVKSIVGRHVKGAPKIRFPTTQVASSHWSCFYLPNSIFRAS